MSKKSKAKKILFSVQTKAELLKIARAGKAETSGQLIRARLVEGKRETLEIVKEVLKKFKGHTTKASDVYWNACQMRKAGLLSRA